MCRMVVEMIFWENWVGVGNIHMGRNCDLVVIKWQVFHSINTKHPSTCFGIFGSRGNSLGDIDVFGQIEL